MSNTAKWFSTYLLLVASCNITTFSIWWAKPIMTRVWSFSQYWFSFIGDSYSMINSLVLQQILVSFSLIKCWDEWDSTIEKQSLFIRISPLHGWNSVHFITIGWDPWIEKRVDYLKCIEGNGVYKTWYIFHNSTRRLFLVFKSFLFEIICKKSWRLAINRFQRIWILIAIGVDRLHFSIALKPIGLKHVELLFKVFEMLFKLNP